MHVFECVRTHRATRLFRREPVPEQAMRRILEAGRRTGSSKNRQGWRFVVVQNSDALQSLADCGQFAGHVAGAAAAIVVVMDPGPPTATWFDAGRAAQDMMLVAWELGIGTCIATLNDQDRARELLGVPSEKLVATAISLGYAAELTPEQRDRARNRLLPRGRKPLSEVVSWERW